MSRRTSLGIVVAGVAAGSLAVLAVTPPDAAIRAAHAAVGDLTRQLGLFGEVFQKIRTDYVVQPDEKSMVTDALGGMVSGLDAQSAYFTPGDAAQAAEKPGDATATVGLLLTIDDGAAKVISVVDGSSAAAAGILSGDAIVAINGDDLAGVHLLDITQALDCTGGKPVNLTLLREGMNDPFSAKLQCAALPAATVAARAEGPVGYLRIARFTSRTPDEVKAALAKIHAGADKIKGYVLDLRNNPGGSLEAATAVAGDFLGSGSSIASVRGRDPADNKQLAAAATDAADLAPLIVLVNAGSAAEAEVVAGALKDDHRATVIGTRSFGTGLVQSIIPLGREGTLRLTTARYYTPSGQAIQSKGIDPDIVVAQGAAPLPPTAQPQKAPTTGASAKQPPSPAYIPSDPQKDKQLQYGLGLVNGTIINPIFQPAPKKPVAG
jgi:carboxyl-terminal processing protease